MVSRNDYGVQGSPNSPIAHPNGFECYGRIPEIIKGKDQIPAGDIFLRIGRHSGPNRGFGVRHIWAEHQIELQNKGYNTVDDVSKFIMDIILPGTPIHCEFDNAGGRHRVTVLKTSLGIVVLEPKEDLSADSGWIYSVVTAYTRKNAHGTLVGNVQ